MLRLILTGVAFLVSGCDIGSSVTVRRALFETILEQKFDLSVNDENEANFGRRLNLLIADNERGKTIVIEIAGRVHELPESAENGHFSTVLSVPASELVDFIEEGWVPYSAVTRSAESREFAGQIRLAGPTGISIVSDIDDTAKISNVTGASPGDARFSAVFSGLATDRWHLFDDPGGLHALVAD